MSTLTVSSVAGAAPSAPPPAVPASPTATCPARSSTSPGAAPASAGLRLEQAIELALSRNERAKISDLNVTVADAAVERARAGFLPVLTFGANDTQTAVLAAGQPGNVAAGNLVLTQPILNPSAFPLYARAKALANAQRAQNTDDKRLLAYSAATAFFAVLSEGALVDAARRDGQGPRPRRGRGHKKKTPSPPWQRRSPSSRSSCPSRFMSGIVGKFFLQFGVTLSVAVALHRAEPAVVPAFYVIADRFRGKAANPHESALGAEGASAARIAGDAR